MSLFVLFQLLACTIFHITSSTPPIWQQAKTSLPTNLSIFVAGLYENNIYLIGGVIDQFGWIPNKKIFHLNADIIETDSTLVWEELIEFPAGGICCFDAQHKGTLSVYSQGSSSSNNILFIVPYVTEHHKSNKPTVLLIFDMERKLFRSPQTYKYQLKEALSDPCIVSTDKYVYIIGGVRYIPPSHIIWKNTLQIYDIQLDEWLYGPSLVTPRRAAACSILGGNLFVFGGRGMFGDLNSIERLNINKNDKWQILSSISLKKYDEKLRAVVDKNNDLIYLFGGKVNSSLIQVFDKNDLNIEKFYLMDNNGKQLDERFYFVPLLYDNQDSDDKQILLMGGETDAAIPQNTIYSVSLSSLNNYYFNELKKLSPLQAIGSFSKASQDTIQIVVDINLFTNKVYITLDGPATKYFAIGFNARQMSDKSYTIIVYGTDPNIYIEERKLGTRNPGDILDESMLIIDEIEQYTKQINGQYTLYRTIKMSRDRIGITNDHYTFPSKEKAIDIIFAHGPSDIVDKINYHFNNRDTKKLLFHEIQCKSDGSLCNNNIDYCCNTNVQCNEVVQFNLNEPPIIESRCCIANDDIISSCFVDSECCGDYVCNGGICQEPICHSDGYICNEHNCCERDVAICDMKYYGNLADQQFITQNVCCINTINLDTCVFGGCCGILQCDLFSNTCRYDIDGLCNDDLECLTGLQCQSGSCLPIPTLEPSSMTTSKPTEIPTKYPSNTPTDKPTPFASNEAAPVPSNKPTLFPSNKPTPVPSNKPTSSPINRPTPSPSNKPTPSPSNKPTPSPSNKPTPSPTNKPTSSSTNKPTPLASNKPTSFPSNKATPFPSNEPTPSPSNKPTPSPSNKPSPSTTTTTSTCVATSEPCLMSKGDDQCCSSDSVCRNKWSGPNKIYSQICCENTINFGYCILNGCCGFNQCNPKTNKCCVTEGYLCGSNDHCCEGLICQWGCCQIITQSPISDPSDSF